MDQEIKENREHKDHKLNPRRWPRGSYRAPVTIEEHKIIECYAWDTLLSVEEMELVYHLAKIQGSGLYANLGHAQGGSAILMSMGLAAGGGDGTIYTFDINRQRGFVMPDNVTFMRRSTLMAAEEFKDDRFKLVFVDADHTYDSVVADFQAWWPLLTDDGLIAFHDTNQDWSHTAIEDYVIGVATEREELHVDRIRVFGR